MSLHSQLIQLLDSHGCVYQLTHHEAMGKSEEVARLRGVDPHTGAKALVTKGQRTGTHYLFVIPGDMKLHNGKAKKVVGEDVDFSREVEVVTGCVPGSVPPFGSILGLRTIVDPHLGENEIINFNAASLTDSVAMAYTEYLRIEKPEIVEVAK